MNAEAVLSQLDKCDLATLVLLAQHANQQPCIGMKPSEVLTLLVYEYAAELGVQPVSDADRAQEILTDYARKS